MPGRQTTSPKIVFKRSERKYLTLVLAVLFVTTPALGTLVWYKFTGRVAPLAITQEYQARQGNLNGVAIIATVAWGTDIQLSKNDVRQVLRNAFGAHGEEVVVIFNDTNLPETTVTYRVGANSFGSLPLSSAGQHVRMAVDALRLYR